MEAQSTDDPQQQGQVHLSQPLLVPLKILPISISSKGYEC